MMDRLNNFKSDCINLDFDIVVQKYLIDGSSYFFDTTEDADEFEFKKDIARSLDVHLRDIVIVGSGKLGFSIKPDKAIPGFFPFKVFDANNNAEVDPKKSDLDVAIISGHLFDRQLIRLYNFTSQYLNQEIWKKTTDRNCLAKYILKGWLRPDYIPKEYKISDSINEIQEKYRRIYSRDVNIGIYKSWYFFENYHINNIRNINLNIIANG